MRQYKKHICPNIDSRTSSAQRGYNAQWQRIRKRHLTYYPTCAHCDQMATIVDHILPLRSGGTNAATNLQSLCVLCHARKTAKDKESYGR